MSNRVRALWKRHVAEIDALYGREGHAEVENFTNLMALFAPYLLALAEEELESDLRPKTAASDLVQQTMVEAWIAWNQFSPQTSVSQDLAVWLRQILRHNLADARRRYRFTQRRNLEREKSLEGPESLALRNQLTLAETSSKLLMRRENCERLLKRLPRTQAAILRWLYLEGWSHADIALKCDRSERAVRVLERRALSRLRELAANASN